MDYRFDITDKGNYEHEFSFKEDSFYSEDKKSESLTVKVKELAEKLNEQHSSTELEDAYRNLVSAKIDEVKEKLGDCRIYDFDHKFESFIENTLGTFIFFYQKKNNRQTVKFRTGESLTLKENDFSINLMFPDYPVFWNKVDPYTRNQKLDSNTDYQFFITEVSKQENEYWKLEIILTKANEGRYSLGGRFKLFIKENDILDFKYYDNELYHIKAAVTKLDYNEIELTFEDGVSRPMELYQTEQRNYW